jgi:signal transduction histidine kinase
MRERIVKMAVCALCWMSLATATGVNAADVERARRVLILSDQSSVMPGVSTVQRNAESVIRTALQWRVEFNAEYLDAGRYPQEKLSPLFLNYVREKYASHPPDLIVALCTVSFDLLAELAKTDFPSVPIVLMGLTEGEVSLEKFGPNVTGFIQRSDMLGTMELILKLQPEVRRIVVIGGTTPFDKAYLNRVREDARSLEGRVAVEFWTDRSLAELEKDVSSLDRDTAVFYTTIFRDSTGESFVPVEAAQRIVDRASVPVYGFFEGIVKVGAVGGSVIQFETIGKKVGEFAGRILQGGSANSNPLELHKDALPVFNWTALHRWGIDENRLPPGSVLEFRTPSAWEKYRWYVLAGLAIITFQTALIIGLFVQRSRFRKVERSLRESHNLIELASGAGHLGLWVRDLPSGEVWANRTLRTILGFKEEAVFQIDDLYGRIHPGDRDRALAAITAAAGNGQLFEFECRLSRPGGTERWVLVKGKGVLDSQGRLIRTQGVVVDKTASKQTELQADRQREELTHIQRISTMGELAASLAHELNQPLTAILSNAQAAQRFLLANPADMETLQEILRDIIEDNSRASEVIRRLRSLVRKEAHEYAALDLAGIVRNVMLLVQSDAVLHNVNVSLLCSQGPHHAWGDKVQLTQVVLNLLLNAFDSMKDIPADERRVVVRIEQNGPHRVKVTVSDRGHGLPGDRLEKIFEPFYTTKPDGMGMGLTISRSIIEAHGGRLWAENNPDGGATFNFTVRVDRRRTGRVGSQPLRELEKSDHLGQP